MKPYGSLFPRTALAVAVALVAAAPAMAQNTTAAISGRVVNPEGRPVAGATVVVVHRESGSTSTLTTDAEGRYNARGLRAGGPYTVTVSKDGERSVTDEIYLLLAETTAVDLRLGTAAQQLEQVVVTASGSGRISSSSTGAGTNISNQELNAFASIQRNLQDYARLDPRIAQTDKERGEISAAGQNSRYNSITIDGVSINDSFGLESNNLPTLKQPISVDAIQSVQINLSNYDVTQKGYTGANINAVTKSGTNEFKGSLYYVYRDANMAGDRYNRTNNSYFTPPSFKEDLYGFTLGGPIIKDKLFFFVNYEELASSRNAPSFGPVGSAVTNVNITPAQIAEAQRIAGVYGFDAGGLNIPEGVELSVKDTLVKIDWNISDSHRANVRYTKTEQTEPIFPGFGVTSLSLNSYWYSQVKTVETGVAQWFADWTEDFSTELKLSLRDYASEPKTAANVPAVALIWNQGGSRALNLGTERFRHFNQLATKTYDSYAAANWFLGDHELKFGFDLQKNEIFNAFLQDTRGTYTFQGADPLALFAAGTPTRYEVQKPLPGKQYSDGIGNWTLNNLGVFLQDTWTVNDKLTINYGVRLDTLSTDDRPTANPAALTAFGYDVTNTLDGEKLVQPRIGFNYQFDKVNKRKSQLRGGAGLFMGAAPSVWLTNPFQNNGAATATQLCTSLTACTNAGVLFRADGSNQPDVPGVPPAANVDFIAPGMSQPSVWKMNLAWDGELPFYGLEAGVEWLHTRVKQGLHYQNLNLGTPTAANPTDGRQMFWNAAGMGTGCWTSGGTAPGNGCGAEQRANRNTNFNTVTLATPTDKGSGNAVTLSLTQRPMPGLRWSLAYTRTSMTEINPLTSSRAISNWTSRSIFNPNEEVAANSNYLIRDRISASVNWSKALIGKYKTTVGVFYEGREGKPYSWVFNNDMNGDGQAGNDLMYIPKAPGSGEVIFRASGLDAAQAEARFWRIVDSFQSLRDSKGKVVGRNTEFAPWTNSIDLRLSQEVPGLFKGNKGVLTLDLLNAGNMLNKRW
ncbi:MAG: TonB-dependent receptor domain-containing protein, partial [Inhella sp.]